MQGGGTSDSGGIWLGMGIWVLEKSNDNVGAQDIQVPRSEQGKGSGKTGLGSKGQEGLKVLPVPLGWGLTLGRGSTILRNKTTGQFAVRSRLGDGPWRSYAIRHNEPPVTGLLEGSFQLFPLVRCVFSNLQHPIRSGSFPQLTQLHHTFCARPRLVRSPSPWRNTTFPSSVPLAFSGL